MREVNPVKDLLALVRLTRLIRQGRYTIVHTHSSKAGILGRWAAHLAGVPVIVHTVHGWGHHERQHPLVRRFYILLERATQRITDKLIVVSPRNTQKGLADGIGAPQKYITIRSGIELDRFRKPSRPREAVRAELGIPQDAPVVGTVTRLSPQKAPLDFIVAAA
ncbi:MAG TPA: glycosyltransferase family 1 protein, partial [Anaerolineae bacterium]|nr:glycosyltransferase family 1 protein [Anaerolineae bacterium]